MRVRLLFALLVLIGVAAAAPAPQRSTLQTGPSNSENKQFIEEVVVESVLQVRTPSAGRSSRTNTQVNLQDGARVAEMRRTLS